ARARAAPLHVVAQAPRRHAALARDLGARRALCRRSADHGEDRGRGERSRRRAAAHPRAAPAAAARDAHAGGAHRRRRARRRWAARRALPARGPAALAAAPRLAVGSEARRMTPARRSPQDDARAQNASHRPAVVLLSGGLDSTTALAWALG